MKRPSVGLALLFAVMAAACSGPLIKQVLLWGVPPAVIAFQRLFFTTAMLAPGTLSRRVYRAELRALTRRDLLLLCASGLCLALHFLCWIESLSIISTFASTAILATQPLFALGGGFLFLGERPQAKSLWGIVLSTLGTVVIACGGSVDGASLWGCLLSVMGALFAACYLLCNKALRGRLSLTPHTFCIYGLCTLVLLGAAAFAGAPLFAYSYKAYIIFFLLAAVCTLGGHSVCNWALKFTQASTVSVALLGEPVGAALLSWLLFGEWPTVWVLLGGALILMGVLWFSTLQARVSTAELPPQA